jgi:hypothetical protein
MTLKRAISLSFLLFVNMVILAHAVIPHHHHDGIPVVAAHQEDDSNKPNHNTEENWLLTIVKARLGNEKQVCQSNDFHFDFLPRLLTLFSDDTIPQINEIEHHPYILSYHTEFIARSLGLRAPPVC